MKTLVLILLCTVGLGSVSEASLKWDQNQIDLHPAPGETTASATFKYTNTGKNVVRFKSVHTSCGCTTTSQNKESVAPGESGEITATVKLGSNSSLKSIRVETDDPAQPVTTLVLHPIIKQLLELRPTFIYWENSEPAKTKVIDVKAAKELNARTLKVTSSSPDYVTKIKSAGPNEFRVEVTPRDTSHPSNTTIRIEPDGGGTSFYATARVINPSRPN